MDITEDQTSLDQLRESFQGVAGNKVCVPCAPHSQADSPQSYVTELDLRLAHIPASAIDYLREAMPAAPNQAGEPEYDYEAWLDSVFES